MPTETGKFTDQELTKIHTLIDQKKIDPDAACLQLFQHGLGLVSF